MANPHNFPAGILHFDPFISHYTIGASQSRDIYTRITRHLSILINRGQQNQFYQHVIHHLILYVTDNGTCRPVPETVVINIGAFTSQNSCGLQLIAANVIRHASLHRFMMAHASYTYSIKNSFRGAWAIAHGVPNIYKNICFPHSMMLPEHTDQSRAALMAALKLEYNNVRSKLKDAYDMPTSPAGFFTGYRLNNDHFKEFLYTYYHNILEVQINF
jgi:hypothetical protein